MDAVSHWDEIAAEHHELGPMNARWRSVSGRRVGVSRIEVAPDGQSTPAHLHTAEEELFHVLDGDGLWWQDGTTTRIGAGDAVYAEPGGAAHTIIGGEHGIDVLAFGPRIDIELVHLPRPGVVRVGGVTLPAQTRHQWLFEAEEGPVERSEPGERPAYVVHAGEVPEQVRARPGYGIARRFVGRHFGARTTGMSLFDIQPGARSFPMHFHASEEELFVVLDGAGTLRLGTERQPVRAGHVVSRPSGTGVAHQFIAGDDGLQVLAYSEIDRADLIFYPDSNKIGLNHAGVWFRIEPLDYWDGED